MSLLTNEAPTIIVILGITYEYQKQNLLGSEVV